MEFKIKSWVYLKVAIIVLALLIVIDLAAIYSTFVLGHPNAFGLIPRFRMDFESNVPTALAALNIFLAALLLGGLAGATRSRAKIESRSWGILCVVFAFLALDELSTFHELVDHAVGASQGVEDGFARLWILPYAGIAVLVGIMSLRLLLRLPTRTRWNMVIAGLLYVAGAAGIEMVGGRYLESLGGVQNLGYALLTTAEETLEFVGMILFVWTLLRHIEATGLRLALVGGRSDTSEPG
ncbi:MAG TPA: hypothetical protein VIK52_05935 [Opitutaceae bacterium]